MTIIKTRQVLLIGGPDVDARIQLMRHLPDFIISAVGSSPNLEKRFEQAGFSFHYYPLHRHVNPISDVLTFFYLARLFRRLQPDIVHTFDTKPGVFGRLAARVAGVPVILGTLPGLGVLYTQISLRMKLVRLFYELMQKTACQLSDLTVFQNHDDAEQFEKANIVKKEKSAVILSSGIAVEEYTPDIISDAEKETLRRDLNILPGTLVVTMIARIIRSKGVMDFAQAANMLKKQGPPVTFLLIGSTEDESADALTKSDLEMLQENVFWLGQRSDIPALLAISDVFVLPTAYREGVPRVLLEAGAMGLPLISTDVPGCREVVIDQQNGFVVPTHNSQALCQAIETLLLEPELRRSFGIAARSHVVQNFDLTRVADETRQIYHELLAKKGLLA